MKKESPIPQNSSSNKLVRRLGRFDSTMMMVGIVIGSGIFVTTGLMAKALPSPGLILLAWLTGGLIVMCGALTYAELGAAFPESGGQYVYLKKAYGPLWGFLFGWKMYLVSMSGAIAALGAAFSEYFSYFFPSLGKGKVIFATTISFFNISLDYSLSKGQMVAVSVILILSLFNYLGVGLGKYIQNFSTLWKIGIILILIVLGLTMKPINSINLAINPKVLNFDSLLFGFGIALIAVFWAFDGWNNINYVAGEIKNPQKNLPFSLIVGTIVITCLYLLVNVVYILALPVEEMSGVVRIAEKATTALHGKATAGFLSVAIMVSIFGALNGAVFAGPRVYYAMAKDKLFFNRVAKVHPRFKTPGYAIILQAIWASFLTLTGTFEQLFTFAMFINILFWAAAAASIFRLRKIFPTLSRPYKTWGYPVVPIIFILALSGILLNTLFNKPVESVSGLVLSLIGIPVYLAWTKKIKKTGDKDVKK